MPVRKQEAHRALELLEEYHCKLNKPQDKQLRNAIERVIRIFKSRLFQALLALLKNFTKIERMFMKKIVELITSNQSSASCNEIEECPFESPETLLNGNTSVKDNDHETALKFSAENNFVNTFSNFEGNRNVFAKDNQEDFRTEIKGVPKQVKKQKSEEIWNSRRNKGIIPSKNIHSTGFLPVINEMEVCPFEEPETIVNRNTSFKDDLYDTSSSLTSILNFSFAPENDFVSAFSNSEENKNLFTQNNQEDFRTVIDDVLKQTKKQESEDSICNSCGNKDTYTSKNTQCTEFLPSDNGACDIHENTIGNHVLAMKSSSTSCHLPFSEESSFKRCISGARYRRNVSTQTEAKPDKRCHSPVIMKSLRKHTYSQIPGCEKRKVSFSSCASATRCDSHDSFKEKPNETPEPVYGALYVFGCNRVVPEHLVEKMNSKYILHRRRKANGIIESFSYVRSYDEPICGSPVKHVISYSLSRNRSVVVSFKHDPLTDMFQIGRDEKAPIDFRVIDINPSEASRNGVSRFACRILVRRDGSNEARVYAAAFDSSHTIFIGENGTPSSYSGKMDGFTTNGVLIMHPGKGKPGIWREVSVSGYIYPLRTNEHEISKRPRLLEESNVLKDGTMIDLCGVTLVWRSPEGLKKIPDVKQLKSLQTTLHRSVPECDLLKAESKLRAYETSRVAKKAYVYISCGHVIGLKLSRPPEDLQKWSCPVCRVIGPITELKIALEPGFYVDEEFPSHAFKPCGHAASLQTIKYWSSTEIPMHRTIQDSHCPFCGVKLNFISKYVRLILPVR